MALISAPAALASGDTIKAAPGVQFSGVVDGSPSCQPSRAIINWGDSSQTSPSPGTIDPHNFAISGTHTYAAAGTYNGTVTLAGGNCAAGTAPDTFTADVSLAPGQFKQCPPVDNNTGCQFLIVASSSGTSIQQDSSQPAYDDGSDDALIGIQNNTGSPISSIPFAGTSGLFGFESDGLCDPGSSPIPSGCRPTGSPPGTTCVPSNANCAFPAPPGQPAGYVEPGNLSGDTQNGYEGPATWFSNISADQSSGQINFSPALQPGQSTYFSLEEPPSASSLNASASPQGVVSAPPTVTPSSASFTGFVNPNGSPTTAVFQYGLDPRYGRAGAPFSHSTAVQSLGGDFASHFVTGFAAGLTPNAVYDVRLAATNRNGTTFGPSMIFTTGSLPPPKPPTLGRNFNASVGQGIVLVLVKGQWVPLTELTQLPLGTLIDALHGTVNIVTGAGSGGGKASDAKAKAKHVKTYSGAFGGAVFKVTQAGSGRDKGQATLSIAEGAFKGAPGYNQCKGKASDGPVANAAVSSRILQTLRARATGRFRTRGRYAAGTVRGTKWNTIDRCNATGVQVLTHSVLVTDFVKHITVLVKAGQRYIAQGRG